MASMNPFDLLGDDDNDDPSQLIIAAQQQQLKAAPKKALAPAAEKPQPAPQGKLPSKPLPPAQAVREAKTEMGGGRGGGRAGGRGFGRGGRGGGGFNRDYGSNENANNNGVSGGYGGATEDGESGRLSERGRGSVGGPRGRGGRRGGFGNGEAVEGDRPRRQYDRRSGTGRGNELKREGSGRANWGTASDELVQLETEEQVGENERNTNTSPEIKQGEEDGVVVNKENAVNEPEEKEPEEKEMTLEEYEKVLEEKRKALQALKAEERKVDFDKEFESMQQLSGKKANDDLVFIKLGSEKDKRKDIADKEEKAKKSVSINEFLKPAEGGRYYGRGRGRGDRGSRGGYSGGNINNVPAPSIEDPGQFPTLGAK